MKNYKFSIIFILIIALCIFPIIHVHAQENTDGEMKSAGSVEDDILLTGDTIVVDDPIDGDVIAIGRTVQINSQIGGSLIAVGRDISIDGQVAGSVYAAGGKLELGEMTEIGRSLYFVGVRLITDSGSKITRDLTVLSISASLSGQVGRDLNTIIGLLDILDNFTNDDIKIIPPEENNNDNDSGNIPLKMHLIANDKLNRNGILNSNQFHKIDKHLFFSENGKVLPLQQEQEEPPIPSWLSSSINTFVTLLVFGLLAIWIIPKWIDNASIQLKQKPFRSTGYGLIGVVLSLNMVGVVLLVAVIIGVVGFFLGVVLIWALAWSVWALGFSSLAIATTLFGLFVFFISKVIVAYFIGSIILSKVSVKLGRYKILALLVGILIYVLLISIPYIGWVIGILVTALGIGSGFLAYLQHNKNKKSTIDIETLPETIEENPASQQDETPEETGEKSSGSKKSTDNTE